MTHLYVAVGERGLVKVGRSRQPQARHKQLKAEFRKRGDSLVRFHPFQCARDVVSAERWIVEELRTREPATCGTEWFRTIGEDEAVGFTRRVSAPPPVLDRVGHIYAAYKSGDPKEIERVLSLSAWDWQARGVNVDRAHYDRRPK